MRLHPIPPVPQADPSWNIAIVRSSYYEDLVTAMEEEAKGLLMEAGLPEERIISIAVPGAFEIPRAVKGAMEDADGIIALGIIIQGETFHAQEIARACTDGLMQLQLEKDAPPIAHAVLYVRNLQQAEARSRGKKSKGAEAAGTLLRLLQGKPHLRGT